MTLRLEYKPGAPLYAQRPLKFRGVQYAHHAALPVDQMSPAKHRTLWVSGHASHLPRGPFGKPPSAASAPTVARAPRASTTARGGKR